MVHVRHVRSASVLHAIRTWTSTYLICPPCGYGYHRQQQQPGLPIPLPHPPAWGRTRPPWPPNHLRGLGHCLPAPPTHLRGVEHGPPLMPVAITPLAPPFLALPTCIERNSASLAHPPPTHLCVVEHGAPLVPAAIPPWPPPCLAPPPTHPPAWGRTRRPACACCHTPLAPSLPGPTPNTPTCVG